MTTKPHPIEQAATEGRLFLKRTKGSLSGGTRVTLAPGNQQPEQGLWFVQAPIIVNVKTHPFSRKMMCAVLVTTDDLVIQHKKYHANEVKRNRRQRRAQAKLDQLKREV